MRAALVQLSASDNPQENLRITEDLVRNAAAEGAGFVLTPEVTNCVSQSRQHQLSVLQHQDDDITLAGLRQLAAELGIWLSIGSLALKTSDPDGRFANRSFLIAPTGEIAAQYDKIHMFDVTVSETETYHESAGYRPGNKAVLADAGFATIGLSICYDLRFPSLYRALAKAGAEILLVPSAFSPVTGKAHWHALLQARAIETGAFVLAAAQTGVHAASNGRERQTYGHSIAISPWGEILTEMGSDPGIALLDLDISKVSESRGRIASLQHDRPFESP